ncbi:MAG: 4Fe-4S dicluster domain-containing protein [Candidatus Nezhaarchaeota archaeon]|nr:4Fe-4S dicluster domain-containing protein [Candidatus Nezhaarchaeota archaeon]MCX8141263.1 4Fe-4S dicluster domain-containing protein [Candidatus Nezhaarchaeota archaeon]MDW8049529.1 4Fe-4S dicluster domain-containing protein [Nitrososphaerota archaeon]
MSPDSQVKLEEFRKLLLEFARKKGIIPAEVAIEVPELVKGFGKPIFDSDKCWGCAACSVQCLGNALRLIETQNRRRIYMDYWKCVACEECSIKCPKEAVKVERIFDLSSFLSDEPALVVDVELRRCTLCGSSISSVKQVEEVCDLIKALPISQIHLDRIRSLCEECKKIVTAKILLMSRGVSIEKG